VSAGVGRFLVAGVQQRLSGPCGKRTIRWHLSHSASPKEQSLHEAPHGIWEAPKHTKNRAATARMSLSACLDDNSLA
jgi:hypothetical protein